MSLENVYIGDKQVSSINFNINGVDKSIRSISPEPDSNKYLVINGDILESYVGQPKKLQIPNTIKEFAVDALQDAVALEKLSIPDTIEKLPNSAISGCTNLIYTESNNGKYLGNDNNQKVAFIDRIDSTQLTLTADTGCKILSDTVFQNSNITSANLSSSSIEEIQDSTFTGCNDLTSVSLPSTLKKIGANAFYSTALQQISLPEGLKEIGTNAFYNCSALAPAFSNVSLPNTITKIGSNAFNGVSYSGITNFSFHPINHCILDDYALSHSGLEEISGTFTHVGCQAFNSELLRANIELKDIESVDELFDGCYNLTSIDISRSNIKSFAWNSMSFYDVGVDRPNKSNNRLIFDLRNSTFTGSPNRGFFNYYSSGVADYYISVLLPITCTYLYNFSSYDACFRSCGQLHLYLLNTTPPRVENNYLSFNTSGLKIFVPLGYKDAYVAAAPWSNYASYLYEWIPENTYEQGYILPSLDDDGYEILWYDDVDMTHRITQVTNPNVILYRVFGSKVASKLTDVINYNCYVSIEDENHHSYYTDDLILNNTTLTITVSPINDFSKEMYVVDWAPFESGDTYTVTDDFCIYALCNNGTSVFSTTLQDNSWKLIKLASRMNMASSLWSKGDTKTTTDANGNEYIIRIADLQPNRYSYAKNYTESFAEGEENTNTPTHIVFEFTQTPETAYKMNESSGYVYYYNTDVHKNIIPITIIPSLTELKPLLEDIIIKCADDNLYNPAQSTHTTNVPTKLFLPAYAEVYSTETSGRLIEAVSTYDNTTQFGRYDYYTYYYPSRKQRGSTQTYSDWALRSKSGGDSFVEVENGGSSYVKTTSYTLLSLFFAW